MTTVLATSIFSITNRLLHEYGIGDLLFAANEVGGSTITDTRLVSPVESSDKYVGAYVRIFNPQTNMAEVRQIQQYDPLTGQLTVFPPLPIEPMSGLHVQIWRYYNPSNIVFEIDDALRSIPLKKIIPMTAFDPTVYKLDITRNKDIIFAIELFSNSLLSGQIRVILNPGNVTFGPISILPALNTTAAIVTFNLKYDYNGPAEVTINNETNGSINDIHVLRDYSNTVFLTTHSRAYPADVQGMYELTDYFDYKLQDNVYDLRKIDWSHRKRIEGWYMPDEKTLILPKTVTHPVYAYVQQPFAEGIDINFMTRYNLPYEVNENLLLHKLAENIFARLLSQAAITGIDTKWAEAMYVRARENAAAELLKENMRTRSNVPKDRGVEYILGDTYFGSVW